MFAFSPDMSENTDVQKVKKNMSKNEIKKISRTEGHWLIMISWMNNVSWYLLFYGRV